MMRIISILPIVFLCTILHSCKKQETISQQNTERAKYAIQIGEQTLQLDLADAHLKALEALNKADTGFTCNLGTGNGSSVLEVITSFEKATGKKIPFEIVGRRAGDVTEAWADPSYAEKLLDWKTVRGLEEMLADAWNWQSKNPQGYRA